MTKTSAIDRARGFTLLELLVVMAILVAMAAAVPITLDHALPSRRVAAAQTRVVAAIRAAETSAAAAGRPMPVDSSATRSTGSTEIRATDASGKPVGEVLVFPDGSARAARFEIVDGGRRSIVTLSGITGRVRTERVR